MTNRRLLALPLCAILVGAGLVACDGGTAEVVQTATETATPTRTAVGTTPTVGPTPSATSAASPSATPADEEVGWGVATIEVATGNVASLYDGAEAILLPEARNGGIWLDGENGEAVRYTLGGTPDDRVAGWGVLEAPGSRTRSYFTEVDVEPSPMLVEQEGEELLFVEGTWIANRTFSPDGRWLAWLDWTDAERHLITIANLESGAIEVAATVSPCACDGFHYIEWSPSGRYLAYDNPSRQDASARGIYILEVGSGEAKRAEGDQWVIDGWVEANDGEYLLTLDGRAPTLTPAGEGDTITLNDRGTSAGTLADLVVVFDGVGSERTMALIDPVSGERIRELRGTSDAVLTPEGIATAVISRNDLTCTGVEVSHPSFEERLHCTAEDLRWSPDGRYLALIPQAQSAPVQILDVTTGQTTEVPHVGPRGTVPEWSEDSRYLVWVWGSSQV